MRVIDGSECVSPEIGNTAVALGTFDGVHIGHQRLIARCIQAAKRHNHRAVAYTFEPHPVHVLSPHDCPPLLQNRQQKLASLEATGIDVCIVEPFTRALIEQEPAAFFRTVLLERLHAQTVVVGYDFTFGLHRSGTAEVLEELGRTHGIEVIILEAQFIDDTLISSTAIRHMIARGDVADAALLLGRAHRIEGGVVGGRGIGGALAAHTANIETTSECVPANGVYLTSTIVPTEGILPSITSIGDNPTFPKAPYAIETHIIDREIDLLGQQIAIDFIDRMRDQIAFETQDALKKQIALDIAAARKRHRSE